MHLLKENESKNIILHQYYKNEILSSKDFKIIVSKDDGISFSENITLPVSVIWQILIRIKLFRRALRLGIRTLRKLGSGTILAIAHGIIYRIDKSKIEAVYKFEHGIGPLREGWCEDEQGNVYIGEYILNNQRKKIVNLIKSSDDGRTWQIIKTYDNIRHIHCVQYDNFEKKIWIGTGDRDDESMITYTADEGESYHEILAGNQHYRTLSLMFTRDYIYWGSDIPTRQNYIFRYDRQHQSVEKMVAVDGPVYYSTQLGNGIKIFATTVEGNSEGFNAAWDDRSHLWASEDGIKWHDVDSWKKDGWPYILGYGRILFAQGYCKDGLLLTLQALEDKDDVLLRGRLII